MTIQLVDYSFFTGHYKMIAIDLSKLQLLHAGIEETDFTGNLDRDATIFFFIIEEAKGTIMDILNCETIVNLFYFNITSI